MNPICVRNESGKRVRLSTMRQALGALLQSYNVPSCRIDVLVTDNDRMRTLNQQFRKVDEATDVLSFPGPDWEGAPLGDIAISIEFAQRGAEARNASIDEELAFLAVHGGLHLLGFGDESDAEKVEMIKRMNEVMLLAGLKTDSSWASQPHTLQVKGRPNR